MKKIILSNKGLTLVNEEIIKESYGDKISLVKDYLDKNFMRGAIDKNGEMVGIFVKINNGIPTSKTMWKQDVLDILEREFNKILSDKKERDGFLNQVTDDWFNRKITKYGNLSSYNF